ncbi:MAG: carboxypeptidase regulatory-like domain-containing protein [Candidatus Sulfotelmatobacter sp.]
MTKLTCGMGKDSTEDDRGIIRKHSSLLAVCLVILGLSAAGLGQELAATLTGTVTDSSGAVVGGATVVVHNNETGSDIRTATTSATGSFNITNLPAGRYTVTVKNPGFQSFVANDVILNVAEKHTLDMQLKTGKVSETVEVTAENVQIQTTTAEQSGTVTGEQVRELALNNRNFEQLILLQPGVANQLPDKVGFGLANNTSISVNGARTGANNYTVDGADINDSGSNGTLLNTPSIDAIQEFTLERSNYDAAFGRSGGGQIVVATKSGTNTFHGSAYEFNRNNYYNANTFAGRAAIAAGQPLSSADTVPIERYNDFGFTLGGPLFIPKLYHPQKDKTFFFWSEEWRKASTPGLNIINVPTPAELAGSFASPVTVAPAGCVTTAGGISTISPSCYSKNATAYLNAFMVNNPPNSTTGQLITNYSQLNNFRQDIIRLDQNIGDRVRVFGRYMEDVVPQNEPFSLWGGGNYPGVETTSVNAPGRNLVVNASATISPKVVNEVEYVDAWGAINSTLSGIANSPTFLGQLTNNTKYMDPNGRAPDVSFLGGTQAVPALTGLGNGSAPYFERNIDKNIFDNLSIQHGNHTIRAGFTAMWMQKTENASAGYATFDFSPTNGNPAVANFLLGQADSYTQPSKDTIPHLRYVNFEVYVQDDWKVTPRLTINAGVRWSYFPSPTDSNNTLNSFDPLLFNPANAAVIDPISGSMTGVTASGAPTSAATYANGLIFPTGTACTTAQAIAPQVSCSPFGSRVNPNSNNNWGPRLGLAWDPRGDGKMAVRAGFGIFYDRLLNGIWEQNAFTDPPLVQTVTVNNNSSSTLNLFDNPLGGQLAGPPLGPNGLIATGTPTFKVPSYMDYNLSVQREILPSTVLEVGYVGTKGTHLLGDVEFNQPTLGARLANPGVDVNGIRPYAGYGAITDRIPIFTSNYNSLQASLNRRFSKGLTVQLGYTWSRLLTTSPEDRSLATYNTYNLGQSYGPSTLNTPQMFIASYVYDLPFYKNQNGFTGKLLGGWEISGITSIQTGQSLSITQSSDPFGAVSVPTSVGGCAISATVTSCPLYPGGLGMTRSGSTVQIRADEVLGNVSGPKTAAKFFNTAAFADAVGHFGTSPVGAIYGPGLQVWDMSLIKNTRLAEQVSMQLRLETFNTFNHGNPMTVDTNVDDGASFGTVNGWHDPRNVQIGAKINF